MRVAVVAGVFVLVLGLVDLAVWCVRRLRALFAVGRSPDTQPKAGLEAAGQGPQDRPPKGVDGQGVAGYSLAPGVAVGVIDTGPDLGAFGAGFELGIFVALFTVGSLLAVSFVIRMLRGSK